MATLNIIANATPYNLTYTSTEYPGDTTTVPASTVIWIGGEDHDYVIVADCSAEQYFAEHHCSLSGDSGIIDLAIWNDDENNHIWHYDTTGEWNNNDGVPGTDGDGMMMLMLWIDGSTLRVDIEPYVPTNPNA